MSIGHEGRSRSPRVWPLMSVALALALAGAGSVAIGLSGRTPDDVPASPAISAPTATTEAPEPTPPPLLSMGKSRPIRVTIRTIAVSSPVNKLGLTSSGALAVPAPGAHYDEVGWYVGSPTPGELGPAVLAGHVDSATTGHSVFWSLGLLIPGALVEVGRMDGSAATFTVTRVARYEKVQFPTGAVYGNTSSASLRLITCGGPIDSTTGHYRDNVVVFAELSSVAMAPEYPRTRSTS